MAAIASSMQTFTRYPVPCPCPPPTSLSVLCPQPFLPKSSILAQKKTHILHSNSAQPSSSSSSLEPFDPLHFENLGNGLRLIPALAASAMVILTPQEARAAEGAFGILEGRSLSLVHPIAMGGLFLYTLWAGYLGWQWRQVRTIQDEINELKKQVKPKEEGAPPSEIELKIQKLTDTRKELLKGGYRDRHFNAGSILLGFGVLEAVGGSLNTWFRTGKLFPGPHLFAGAGITVLWALAAALVPAMQKGNDTARSLHIALNTVNVILFIWQIPTGLEIVLKVLEFTKWP